MLTQQQIAQQMIAQLRVLDPSVSAEIGTPERKIIDTVAQAIAEAEVDLNVLSGSLDLAGKFGSDLDAYVGLFGFGRQSGATATGFVTFSRSTASPYPITIPRGTQVAANITIAPGTTPVGTIGTVTFQTTDIATLQTGQTQVIAPIQALLSGSQGNVAANTITQFANIGAPPLGITAVNNENPTSGGSDSESDAELKVRFKNTVFRNLAGTEDQYLALALSTQFTTKANVIGPISRYQEYMQVPMAADAQYEEPTSSFTGVASNGSPILTNIVVGSAQGQPMVSNVISGTGFVAGTTITDIQGTSYTMSNNFSGTSGTYTYTIANTGQPADGWGGGNSGLPPQWTTLPSNNPYAKYIYTNVPYFMSNGGLGGTTTFYTSGVDFVMNAPPVNLGDTYREFNEIPPDIPNPATTPYNPNFTLYNVYVGGNTSVQLPNPNQVVLVEYSYISAESRNDITRNVLNCVDVYVNGSNPLTGDAVIPLPVANANTIFNGNVIDRLYYQNYRRLGQPTTYPTQGNIFQPLFLQPVIDLPDQIIAGGFTYFLGTHYYCVQDWTLLGDTVRARNGIEWNVPIIGNPGFTQTNVNGMAAGDPAGGPYTGPAITAVGVSSMTVSGYTYDRNIIDLQSAIDNDKQITSDVLAHTSRERYFKFDLTVVYSPGNLPSAINPAIQAAVQNYLDGQYFGTVILLSDILVTVRQVSGVSNVRWSNDVINATDDAVNLIERVTECDVNGNPIGNAFDTDFFLRDNELPTLPTGQIVGDSLPGLILRPRAENTFNIV